MSPKRDTTTNNNEQTGPTSHAAPQNHDEKRRSHILDTTCALIQRYGYHRTTMDDIARCAGMSKKTLYLVFPSKESLVEQLLLDHLFSPLHITPNPSICSDLDSQLLGFITQLSQQMMNEKFLGLIRTVIGETTRSPLIAQLMSKLFHLSGQNFSINQWLLIQKQAGRLAFDDIDEAADHLFGLTIGVPFLTCLAHCAPPPSHNDVQFQRTLQRGIQIFLNEYRVITPPSSHH
nr:TetR/AcrR family transcriptional regulator [Saccharibacter sp. 17.LH.SD]